MCLGFKRYKFSTLLLIYAWLSKAVTMVTGGYKYFIMASVVTPSRWTMHKVINSGYSHISVPAQELHSRAAPSVRGCHHREKSRRKAEEKKKIFKHFPQSKLNSVYRETPHCNVLFRIESQGETIFIIKNLPVSLKCLSLQKMLRFSKIVLLVKTNK